MKDAKAATPVEPDTRLAAGESSRADGLASPDELFRVAPIPILIEDWSRIKQRIDSLRESGVRDLHTYLDEHPNVIEELRRLHSFVDANDATLSLFEAASQDIFFAWANRLLPANRLSNSQVLHAIFEGRASCQGERTLTTLGGQQVPIVWRCSLPKEADQYRRLHFYAFDITEYKENSDRLEAMRAEMARTARVSTVGQLVASITHEISQPLSAIRTSLEAALRWLERPKPDLEEALASMRYALRWSHDTSEICHRLRSFLVRAPVEAVELDCAEIVDSATRLIAPEAGKKAITIVQEIEPGITAYADRIQVQQVLINLLINGMHAIEAAGRGGRDARLRVRALSRDTGLTLIEVIDTGCGIKPAQREAIFQPFSSNTSGGMGMGLPICKSIVEAHGGAIWIDATSDEGTRFCFTLPRSARALPAQAH